jgi:hypothetical protein
MIRPSIDHGILSPSGHISKRAEWAAKTTSRTLLFPDGFPEPTLPKTDRRESLLRQAAKLRALAKHGMRPKAYLKRALELEQEATAA